jgi:hypothetical protein
MSLQHYLHLQLALQLLYGTELVHLTLFLDMTGLPRKLSKKVETPSWQCM